jgi:hypothetical protein
LVAVLSQLMAQTPFTHLQLLVLLFQLHLCLHPIWLLLVVVVVQLLRVVHITVALAALAALEQVL